MKAQPQPCYLLDWDTTFFGFPIAQVVEPLLTADRCERIDRWCRQKSVKCLYFRATGKPKNVVSHSRR